MHLDFGCNKLFSGGFMKKVLFIEYPKCTTCQKAKKWLQDHQIAFDDRHITEQHPTADELKKWQKIAGLPLKSFFNTSGLLYKSMDLIADGSSRHSDRTLDNLDILFFCIDIGQLIGL